MPPVIANATGTVALLPGYVSGALGFREDMEAPPGLSLRVRGKGRAVVTSIGPSHAARQLARLRSPAPRRRRRRWSGSSTSSESASSWLPRALGRALRVGAPAPNVFPTWEARSWHVLLLEAVSLAVAGDPPRACPQSPRSPSRSARSAWRSTAPWFRKLPAVGETLGAATVICSGQDPAR